MVLLWLPGSLSEPISEQLHRGEWAAWILMALCGALLLALIGRMVRLERFASVAVLFGVLGMLGYIAYSDPYSPNHLFCFLAVSLLLSGWMGWMAWELEDRILTVLALGAVAAVAVSLGWLGVGERMLVTCATGAANELFLEHFDL